MAIEDLNELRGIIQIQMTIFSLSGISLFLVSCVFNRFLSFETMKTEEAIRRQEIEKRLQSQETLILRFSHELNNPIHTIMNNLRELKLIMKESQKAQDIIKSAISCTDMLNCFLSNILDVKKADTGGIDIKKTPISLTKYFSEVWSSCETLIESKGLKAKMKFNIETITKQSDIYDIDPHRLRQIIINLVNNSIKFTEKGKIKLFITIHNNNDKILMQPMINYHQEQSQVSLSELNSQPISQQMKTMPSLGVIRDDAQLCRHWLRVELIDTGCGIPKDRIKILFDKPPENDISQGKHKQLKFGLSLWITKQIVESLGGFISIQSSINTGTSAIVLIPIEKQNLFENMSFHAMNSLKFKGISSINSNTRRNKQQVLIVEDVPFNQKIAMNYLQKVNANILNIAENGQIAVNMFKKYIQQNQRVDLICMDIEMPIMNGKEAAKQIRKLEKENNLEECKIMFVSGNTIKSEMDDCLNMEGDIRGNGFLRKPMSYDEFYGMYTKLTKGVGI